MKDEKKTKKQLINELIELRRQITEINKQETMRKKAEEGLREIKERYERITDNADEVIFAVNPDGIQVLYQNPAVERIFGYSKEEFLSDPELGLKIIHPDYKEKHIQLLKEMNDHKKPIKNVELGWTAKNGSKVIMEYTLIPVFDKDGRIIQFEAIGRDITLRKQAEMALIESEAKYRVLIENAREGILVVDQDHVLFANTVACGYTGYSLEELYSIPIDNLAHPEDRAASRERRRLRMERNEVPGINYFRIVTKAGKTRWLGISAVPIEWNDRPAILGFATDITERKLTEQYRERFFNNSIDMMCVASMDGHFKELNPAFEKTLGWTIKELMSKPFIEFVHPEDRKATFERIKDQAQGKSVHHFTNRYLCKDGSYKWISWNGYSLPEEQIIFSVGRDVTEWKMAEETIIKQFNEISFYYDNVPVGLAILDTDLRFLKVNNLLAEFNGVPAKEHVGRELKEIVPELEPKARKLTSKILKTGQAVIDAEFTGETRANPGVCRVWQEGWYPIKDKYNKITNFMVIAKDITDRKNIEKDLESSRERLRALNAHLQNVREEERKQISREIHDELGSELTGMKIDLYGMKKTASWIEDEIVRQNFLINIEAVIKAIDKNINTIRKLVARLRPSLLDDLGLVDAIDWLVKDFEKRTSIRSEFTATGEKDGINANFSIALFRIFQEALTNVASHSGATKAIVHFHSDNSGIFIEVADNGKGIEKEKILNAKSFGLLGMRERANMFGGSLTVEGTPGIGTRLAAKFPSMEKINLVYDN